MFEIDYQKIAPNLGGFISYFRYLREWVYFRTIRVSRGFAQTQLCDGVMVQPIDDLVVAVNEIYRDWVYNRFREIRESDIVVDVGAHVGVFTLRAAKRTKDGLVIGGRAPPA